MSNGAPPLVVFDAVCVLCCAGLHFIVRRDRRAHWQFLAMQTARGAAALAAAGISPTAPASFLVIYDGQASVEGDACLVIARDLGGIWSVLAAAARAVPRPVRNALYRLLARHRYPWFGRRTTCYVPTAGERHRFLAE